MRGGHSRTQERQCLKGCHVGHPPSPYWSLSAVSTLFEINHKYSGHVHKDDCKRVEPKQTAGGVFQREELGPFVSLDELGEDIAIDRICCIHASLFGLGQAWQAHRMSLGSKGARLWGTSPDKFFGNWPLPGSARSTTWRPSVDNSWLVL